MRRASALLSSFVVLCAFAAPPAHAAADTVAPSLDSFDLSSTNVDVTSGDVTVTVTITASDAESGVADAAVTYTSPGGTADASAFFTAPSTPGPGTVTWTSTFVVPSTAPPGDWPITQLQIRDAAGNSGQLPTWAASYPQAVHVMNTNVAAEQPPSTPTGLTANWVPCADSPASAPVLNPFAADVTFRGSAVNQSPSGAVRLRLHLAPAADLTATALPNGAPYLDDAATPGGVEIGPHAVSNPADYPDGQYAWRLSAASGSLVSAPTGWCYVTFRNELPHAVSVQDGGGRDIASPVVTGVLRPSVITLAPGGVDDRIVRYEYTFDRDVSVTPEVINGTVTVQLSIPDGVSQFVVAAVDQYGWRSPTRTLTFTSSRGWGSLSEPQQVTAVLDDRTATVSWQPPAKDGGWTILGYTITPFRSGVRQQPVAVDPSVRSVTFTGLDYGVGYDYEVYASDWTWDSPSGRSATLVPRAGSRLTWAAVPAATYGRPSVVVGRLTSVSGVPAAGVPVELQYRRLGSRGAYDSALLRISAADGTVRFPNPLPTYPLQLRLVTLGSTALVGAVSPVVTVPVRLAVSARTSARVVRLGQSVTVGGAELLVRPGRRVYLQQWSQRRWVNVALSTASRRGTFRFVVRPGRRGTAAYRVVVAGDRVFQTGVSRTVNVLVR